MPVQDSSSFLKALSAWKDVPPVVLFVGEEEDLMADALQRLQARFWELFGAQSVDFNFEVLHGESDDGAKVLDACQTLPVGAGKRLVVLQRLQKCGSEVVAGLESYLAAPNPSTCLVLLWNARPNPASLARPLAAAAARRGAVAKFWRMTDDAARAQWIQERARELGKEMSREAALILSGEGGEGLRELASEIEKCALYSGDKRAIEAEDVRATMSFRRGEPAWELVNLMQRADWPAAGRALERCLEQGEEPVRMLNLLARAVRPLSAGPARRARWFEMMKQADLALKSGHGAECGALERVLCELSRGGRG